MAGAGGGVNGGHNPYEFIMTSTQAPKRSGFSLGGGSASKLLVIVGAVALVIFILGFIVAALAPKGASADELTDIVQRQAELSRVAQLAERNADSEAAKALAYNINLSISSGRSSLTTVMEQKGMSVSEKDIELSEDSATDKTLEDARATSSYDSTFIQLMNDQLTGYLAALRTTYQNTSNRDIKATLQELYDDGVLLLTQAGGDVSP